MSNRMCTCAVHCPLNYCHERACCSESTCDCWCHAKRTGRNGSESLAPYTDEVDRLIVERYSLIGCEVLVSASPARR